MTSVVDPKAYWDLLETGVSYEPSWRTRRNLSSAKLAQGTVLDVVRARANPGDVERLLLNTATQDGKGVVVGFGQDPGQAGKSQAQHLVRALSAFTVRPVVESGDKLTRFGPFSSQCRVGNVKCGFRRCRSVIPRSCRSLFRHDVARLGVLLVFGFLARSELRVNPLWRVSVLTRGYPYRRIEDAYYARNAEIKASAQGRALAAIVCQTLDEFIAKSPGYEILAAA
jgi:predicted phage terminase large subunit-like protein